MPAAVPGLGQAAPVPGPMPMTPFGAAGGAPGGMPGMPGIEDPASKQYVAVTQSDGTVLLHMKLPDGSVGPAVKIISVGGRPKPGA